jgi:uncharacterized protein YprB with RNaseH-like and TPR domain
MDFTGLHLQKILFLDIETVPQKPSFEMLTEHYKALWTKKASTLRRSDSDTPVSLYERAGIYAEFGKVICVCTGYIFDDEFRVKSFYGDDEALLLQAFIRMLNEGFSRHDQYLCAHNGKEFDYPYLARRILINGLKLPPALDMAGKKPWEVRHLDTMEWWKFGDNKSYTSLELLAAVLGIPTPKDDMDGSMVARVYWEEKDLERIVHYCRKDTFTVAQVLLRYLGMPTLDPARVVIVDD